MTWLDFIPFFNLSTIMQITNILCQNDAEKLHAFITRRPDVGPFWIEFECSLNAGVGFLQVHQYLPPPHPPTYQKNDS